MKQAWANIRNNFVKRWREHGSTISDQVSGRGELVLVRTFNVPANRDRAEFKGARRRSHFSQNELNVTSPSYLSANSNKIFNFEKSELSPNAQQTAFSYRTGEQRGKSNCSLCHIPYSDKKAIFGSSLPKCAICKKARVADVIFATIEPPANLPSIGTGCLIQARVFRNKKDTRAKEISDSLPFLEYEVGEPHFELNLSVLARI